MYTKNLEILITWNIVTNTTRFYVYEWMHFYDKNTMILRVNDELRNAYHFCN